jgi:hypothetical protein
MQADSWQPQQQQQLQQMQQQAEALDGFQAQVCDNGASLQLPA